jgi:hypothetical protein
MVSFTWGTYPKKFPEDEEEIKRAIKKHILSSSTNFSTSLKEAIRTSRKSNQKEQFMEIMNRLFNEVLDESIYDYLKEKNTLSSLYVFPPNATKENKDKIIEETEKKFKKITYKDILTNSQLVNDLIGFSFIKFGRGLEKIPQTFNALNDKKIMDAVEVESEFILKEGKKSVKINETNETVEIPNGNISFSVSNNKSLKDAHSIIKIGESTSQIEAKTKFIKNRGVSNFRFVPQNNPRQKTIREIFPFKLDLPEIAKLTKDKDIDTIKISKLIKTKATRGKTKERETVNLITGKTKKVKPQSFKTEEFESFKDTKSVKDYFNENQLSTVLDIIGSLATKNKNKPTFNYGKNTYQVESFGFLRNKNEYLNVDLSDDLDDFIISWFDDKKSAILKPIKSILNNPKEAYLIEIQCKIATKSRGTGSLTSYQKKAKSKGEADEGIESLVEVVPLDKIPKKNLDRIQQLENRIDYLESPDRPIPKSIKVKKYTYTLKNAPKRAYAQLATKKEKAFKLKDSKELTDEVLGYDPKREIVVEEGLRNSRIRVLEKKIKDLKKEKNYDKKTMTRLENRLEQLEENKYTENLNNLIRERVKNNKLTDKNRPEFSQGNNFIYPPIVRADDKNLVKIKERVNFLGDADEPTVLSDLFDKIYEETTIDSFDVDDKESFLTKKQYESKRQEYEEDMEKNPYPRTRLVKTDRVDTLNKKDYVQSSETVNKKLTAEQRKYYQKVKNLTPNELKDLIKEAQNEIEKLKKPVQEIPLTAQRAEELQALGQFSLTEIQDDKVTVRQADDFKALDVGESGTTEELVEILKQASLVCDYYVKKLGYFNFKPFSKGKGKEGVNKKLKEDIDNLAIKIRRAKRLGLVVN